MKYFVIISSVATLPERNGNPERAERESGTGGTGIRSGRNGNPERADESECFWIQSDASFTEHLRKQGALFTGKIRPIARNPLNLRQGNQYSLNARQLMFTIRHADSQLTMVPPCTQPPPPQPNAYADGPLKHPRYQQWALGGFGIWWPSQNLTTDPQNTTEAQYTQAKQVDGGSQDVGRHHWPQGQLIPHGACSRNSGYPFRLACQHEIGLSQLCRQSQLHLAGPMPHSALTLVSTGRRRPLGALRDCCHHQRHQQHTHRMV